ncbi:serine hydrolase domain-containing protein [Actinophytocola oryzae]|uniref:CubicO group peptidase (Beta-lactamase class C family) n=1 Tax=Actinophytocola oryzae TaxID=502181 RepID=A0A4R7W2G5_9PSEU|nr:serine hydrolase domain-containing protein [Actinophytocola oryzae]TDV56208.1 CubicO group peptidase (beta-lactamase class C family) [Actinophytocola oryzae]
MAGETNPLELVRARGVRAQLCVLRDGEVLLDHAVGCEPDSLFWIFSASKPFVALLVHLLAERGELDLDDPVARHWPEFGARGKESVTVRHVLRHRSGLFATRTYVGDALALTDWSRSVRRQEEARPRWRPGEVPAYQAIAFGFILGELVRRVTGDRPEDLLRKEFLDPLGLSDTYLGLPDSLWHRHVPVRGRGLAAVVGHVVNRRATRRAVIPSGGISTTARDLARFYQALLNGGTLDGTRVLGEDSIAEARRPAAPGAPMDRVTRLPARWAQGFQLGHPDAEPSHFSPLGRSSTRSTFGHDGSNCCIGWADPDRRLVFVYLTDLLLAGHAGARHLGEVSDAVIATCD